MGLAIWTLPVDAWLLGLVEWVRAAGVVGVGVYAGIYVVATLLLLPGSLLTVGAGFACGPLWGTLLVSPVSVLAASLAFALGRTVARDRVARRVSASPRFAAVDEAIGESGWKVVLLLRLSPLFPFNLLNYALGLTRVRLRDYVLGSFLGMLPGTVLYVYLGSLVTRASELLNGHSPSTAHQALYWLGLGATAAATVLLTRLSRRALHRNIASTSTAPRGAPVQPKEAHP